MLGSSISRCSSTKKIVAFRNAYLYNLKIGEEMKKLTLKTKIIAIVLTVCFISTGVVINSSVIKSQDVYAKYLTSSQSDSFSDFVKTEAYSIVDGYVDEYTVTKKAGEYLSEQDIDALADSILNYATVLEFTDAEKESVKKALVDKINVTDLILNCSCSLTDLSKAYVANKITDNMKDYMDKLDLNNYNIDELSKELNSSVQNVFSTYKSDIDLTAYITNSDDDIEKQIINNIGLPLLIRTTTDKSVPTDFVNNIVSNIMATTIKQEQGTIKVAGDEYLTDNKISDITNTVSTQLSDSVVSSLDTINSSLKSIDDEMDTLSTQYKQLQAQQTELVEKISTLKASQTSLSGSQLADNIESITNSNTELDSVKLQLSSLETSLSSYRDYVNDIQLVMQTNYTALSSQINTSGYDTKLSEVRKQIDTLISNAQKSGVDSSAFEIKVNELYSSLETGLGALKDSKVDEKSYVTYKNEQMQALQTVYNQIAQLDSSSTNDATELTRKIQIIQTNLNNFNSKYTTDIATVNSGISDLQNDIVTKASALTSEFDIKIANEVDALETTIGTNSIDISSLGISLTSLNDTVTSTVESLDNYLLTSAYETSIASTVNEINSSISTCSTDVSKANSDIISTNVALSSLKMATETSVSSLNENISTLQSTTSEFMTSITNISTSLETAEGSINTIQSGIADVTAALGGKLTESEVKALILAEHPIGDIELTTSNESPATYIGGMWEKITDRMLIGAGNNYAVNSSGGSTTVKLAANQIPTLTSLGSTTATKTNAANGVGSTTSNGDHAHSIPSLTGSTGWAGVHSHILSGEIINACTGNYAYGDEPNRYGVVGANLVNNPSTTSDGNHNHTVTTNASTTGSSGAHAHNLNIPQLTVPSTSVSVTYTNNNQQNVNILNPYYAVYIWKRIS